MKTIKQLWYERSGRTKRGIDRPDRGYLAKYFECTLKPDWSSNMNKQMARLGHPELLERCTTYIPVDPNSNDSWVVLVHIKKPCKAYYNLLALGYREGS